MKENILGRHYGIFYLFVGGRVIHILGRKKKKALVVFVITRKTVFRFFKFRLPTPSDVRKVKW
jgi:hypothetical protein